MVSEQRTCPSNEHVSYSRSQELLPLFFFFRWKAGDLSSPVRD